MTVDLWSQGPGSRPQETASFCLHVVVDADPSALARVLERFQNLNVLPHRVVAELQSSGTMRIQVDVQGVSEDTIQLITAKLATTTCVRDAQCERA